MSVPTSKRSSLVNRRNKRSFWNWKGRVKESLGPFNGSRNPLLRNTNPKVVFLHTIVGVHCSPDRWTRGLPSWKEWDSHGKNEANVWICCRVITWRCWKLSRDRMSRPAVKLEANIDPKMDVSYRGFKTRHEISSRRLVLQHSGPLNTLVRMMLISRSDSLDRTTDIYRWPSVFK